jgi:prepilin-type N-terminal cleavage/methylation domain-containing protein
MEKKNNTKGFITGSGVECKQVCMATERTSSKTAGFTLVETLVAIAILVAAVSGASSAAQTGISLSILSKDQITAFYLAQEGVEQIRNMRDENGLNGRDWLAGIAENSSDPCYFGKVCRVDALENEVVACSGDNCPVLKQDEDTGFFGYDSSWADTGFKREIRLSQISSNEVSLLVTVSWSKGIIEREFKARENIMNWQ